MSLRVIDNVLSPYHFNTIKSTMMGDNFGWYFTDGISVIPQFRRFQFIHNFYSTGFRNSQSCDLVSPILNYLNTDRKSKELRIVRIKANLNTRTLFHRRSGFHTDFSEAGPHTTAIYYVNTNNGYTLFKTGKKVKSVENRLVVFDSTLEHQGITCTDEKIRVVINFNYF